MKKTLYFVLALALLLTALCGCGGKTDKNDAAPAKNVDLKAFFDALPDKYELGMMVELEGEMLDAYYPGLSEIETKQLVAYAPMMSAVVSEFVLVQVANKDDAKKVENIFNERVKIQAEGGAWYPDSMEAWSKAEVILKDDYVALIATHDATKDIAADFEALF